MLLTTTETTLHNGEHCRQCCNLHSARGSRRGGPYIHQENGDHQHRKREGAEVNGIKTDRGHGGHGLKEGSVES